MEVSEGTLLGGRVRYAQPRDGYRTGIEPVLLAASIPARAGQSVLEAGTGAGAALLCLGHRVPGLSGIGVERDTDMAALARRNLTANALPFAIRCDDVTRLSGAPLIDHIFANPPWHDPAGTLPEQPRTAEAKHAPAGTLAAWIGALAPMLRPGGTVTLALPASLAGQAIAEFHEAGLARLMLFPLWPRAGRAAKLVLVQARHGAGLSQVAAGLLLHDRDVYTEAAEAVLRGAQPIVIG